MFNRILGRTLLSGAPLVAIAAGLSDAAGTANAAHGPRLMLYISLPLWQQSAPSRYGLRLERARPSPLPPAASFGVLERRELINLQITQSDSHITFGRSITWDFTNRRVGSQSSIDQPINALRPPTMTPSRDSRASLPGRMAAALDGDVTVRRGSSIITALVPLHRPPPNLPLPPIAAR
jgi:hypothetical protein